MIFSSSKKSQVKSNLAIVISKTDKLPEGLFSEAEANYIQKNMKSFKGDWLEINHYDRKIFVFEIPDGEGFALTEKMRKAGAALSKKLNKLQEKSISIDGRESTLAIAEGLALSNYQFLKYFSTKNRKENSLEKVSLFGATKAQIETLDAIATSVCYARDLINTPVWDLNAPQLGDSAKKAGKDFGFEVDVLNKKKIEALKMGGLLAVNKGSIDPPVFIIMEHKPKGAKNKKPIVLVGKGVVYDTGGLSLKPTASMDDMKCDMSGAAAVLGTMCAVAKANLPVHVVGLIPATDNRPGGNAVTPGDVITISDGTSVEVMNTDAEGRLILADALHYAKKYKPELVVDLATLTGAAAVAIGRYGIVAMGTAGDEAWKKLEKSGNEAYERIVKFPFWEEYDELLKSPIADLKNIGGREGGAITAGKFLANFTDYPYIHLDIAGPAFIDAEDGYLPKGGTGVGVRLLFNFLSNYSA